MEFYSMLSFKRTLIFSLSWSSALMSDSLLVLSASSSYSFLAMIFCCVLLRSSEMAFCYWSSVLRVSSSESEWCLASVVSISCVLSCLSSSSKLFNCWSFTVSCAADSNSPDFSFLHSSICCFMNWLCVSSCSTCCCNSLVVSSFKRIASLYVVISSDYSSTLAIKLRAFSSCCSLISFNYNLHYS